MREFSVRENHEIPKNIRSIIEDKFGSVDKVGDRYLVREPNFDILDEMVVMVERDTIKLGFEEISVKKAKDKDMLEECETVVRCKNELLENLTGKTVEDRKKQMRQESVRNECL